MAAHASAVLARELPLLLRSTSRAWQQHQQRRRVAASAAAAQWAAQRQGRGPPPRQQQQRQQALPAQAGAQPGAYRYWATSHPGLEEVVARELAGPTIRAQDVQPGTAGVAFTGDAGVGYRANLWLRSAIRVLMLLAEADLDPARAAGDELYRAFREAAPWHSLLGPGQSFSVEARVWSCSNLSTSQLVQVRARDAICDAVRDATGTRPEPPLRGSVAELPLYCTAYRDHLSVYRDMSGASLHRRGYRAAMHRASLNEAAAAGILYMAGWDKAVAAGGSAALADPMCGSGTLLIEAALMAAGVAPGAFRPSWPFFHWRDCFDIEAWREAGDAAAASRAALGQPLPAGVELWGNDVHLGALGLAQRDLQASGVGRAVRLHHGDCAGWELPHPPALVVSNPPWGGRLMGREHADVEEGMESEEELAAAWHGLSAFLKRQCPGGQAFLLSGNPAATPYLRLRADERRPLTIGGVDCRLLRYSIH